MWKMAVVVVGLAGPAMAQGYVPLWEGESAQGPKVVIEAVPPGEDPTDMPWRVTVGGREVTKGPFWTYVGSDGDVRAEEDEWSMDQ